ncbi:pyruvate kinase [Streptomyces albidoflavus]|jgi:pyruvate kinase|uniref:Pyruvate kinase n=6 Tax=Streptomyces TaxID=1883 RepID=A0ACC7XVK1_9ACTN|nr:MULTISPECIES: pyruvate kinase [Streptomyces]MYW57468.1 pyruvate kinase [Streptomyces sp. SID8370]MYW83851.1 pyruvate kinase [Streptomyces sp. SID8371]MYX50250.1 pyruvate kinase [Streptomyces sp. SID8385]MYX87637.1 pyruvate kinase [Streptomyces sp. SID4915]NUW08125.1 pyruvate kinase [Streptomyces sp. CAI-21]NVI32839.1 pyruvate kinase [Streptomyces sp. CAI-17]SCE38753.1 pyruvate kinase [Streptomyces sp. IgraMP-1]BDH50434.1 pyruvate kinase [Streptomyces albus]
MRRSKIVCTLGPAVDSYEQLKALIEAGMNVARFNMSHGSHAEHEDRYRRVRQASADTGRAVGVLADLQGPKIRLETFAEGPVELVRGDEFTITTEDVAGDKSVCGTTYKGLPGDVAKGDPILINDGNVELKVTEVEGPRVKTIVIEGGVISDHKGINLPGAAVNVPALSEKDIEDLRFALRMGCDLVALSFVRDAEDVKDVHKVMDEEGRRVPVIAKVEKPQAVANMEAVVLAFDGVMVARGDLAVEYPLEKVPMVQKRLVSLCRRNAKPVIVATQMMESMITNSRPTRAEASDVANAILDGADAVMLSAESSVGAYPIETVKTMSKIVVAAEQELLSRGLQPLVPGKKPRTQGGAVARAAAEIADFLGARALVAYTKSGDTARRLSRYRAAQPILAFTTDEATRNQLTLSWGVESHVVDHVDNTDAMVDQVDEELVGLKRFNDGDTVVMTAGSPPGVPGTTNMVRVHHLGGRG